MIELPDTIVPGAAVKCGAPARIATDCPPEAQALFGSDQAVHDVIRYKNPIPDTRAADGEITNSDGGAGAIVHQYDRHPTLREAIFATYGVDPAQCRA